MKFPSDKPITVLCLSLGRGMAWETPHSRTRKDVCAVCTQTKTKAHTDTCPADTSIRAE